MEYIGVDGCRAGWFWVGLSDNSGWRFGVCENAKSLGAVAAASKLTVIDIPIGLKDAGTEERLCDKEARRVLGPPRAASVFPAPARATLEASDFTEANAINRKVTGRGLNRQTWMIAPKIKEINELLIASDELRNVVREVHPEICFWSFNGKRPMCHNKKKPPGRQERLSLMKTMLPETLSIIESAARTYRRHEVAWDDMLDALAAAVTARLDAGRLRTLPANPPRDALDLPMEMVFAEI